MESRELLIDAYGRIRELVHMACDGLDSEGLTYRPEPGSNSIAWLVWHLTRIQDDHVADIAAAEQVWPEWAAAFDRDPADLDTGFGHTVEQVAAIQPASPAPLIDYHAAVHARTVAYLRDVDSGELDRIVDRSWDPPVSAGVRLISVISDNLQHAGQARYLRGIVDRLRGA